MNRFAKAALAGTALLAATAGAAFAFGGPGRGHGHCFGDGAGFEDGMGPMMGRMGGRQGGAAIDKQLTVDDARAILAGRLAMSGNKRLKVGEVKEKDAETVVAEIVTVDNSLVRSVEISRKTGRFTPVQ